MLRQFLVKALLCVLLLLCALGAKFISPQSTDTIRSMLTYSLDFSSPIQSVMGYAELFSPVQVVPEEEGEALS